MIIEKDEYKYFISATDKKGVLAVIMFDDKSRILDMATIELNVVNEVTKETNFQVIDVANRLGTILSEWLAEEMIRRMIEDDEKREQEKKE